MVETWSFLVWMFSLLDSGTQCSIRFKRFLSRSFSSVRNEDTVDEIIDLVWVGGLESCNQGAT